MLNCPFLSSPKYIPWSSCRNPYTPTASNLDLGQDRLQQDGHGSRQIGRDTDWTWVYRVGTILVNSSINVKKGQYKRSREPYYNNALSLTQWEVNHACHFRPIRFSQSTCHWKYYCWPEPIVKSVSKQHRERVLLSVGMYSMYLCSEHTTIVVWWYTYRIP